MASFPCLNTSDTTVKRLINKHGKDKVYRAFIQNNYVLPDVIEQPRTITLDQAREHLRAFLPPSIPVENLSRVGNLINQQGIKGNLMGAFLKDTVYLNDNTDLNTAYHEAFHGVFRKLLTTAEQDQLLMQGQLLLNRRLQRSGNTIKKYLISRREQGLYSELSDQQAYQRLYEEELAEQFVKYKNEQPKNLLERFFRWIKDLASFFKKDDVTRALFKRIDEGAYVNSKFVKNQFDEMTTPEIAPMLLKYDVKVAEVNGQTVNYDQYLGKGETDEIIRMVAATYQYVKDNAPLISRPMDATMSYLQNRFTITDEQIENLAEEKGLSEDDMYDQWEELEEELKMRTGYKPLFSVLQFPEELSKIRSAASNYLSNFNIEVEESEEEIEEQTRKDADYGKEANQFDPFLNGSQFVKGYIGLSYYINPVEKTTAYTYQTEEGEQTLEIPSIYALDARKVYNGLIRAVNRVGTKDEKLVKIYQFGNLATGNGLVNLSVKHFMDRFLEDSFGDNKNAAIQSLQEGEFPTGLVRQMNTYQAFIFNKIMQAFDLHVLDNDFITVDPSTGKVNVGSANRQNAEQNQIDQWRATFYSTWYTRNDAERLRLVSSRAQVASAFKNKSEGFEKRVVDYFNSIGIDLFEDYVAISSELMHPTGNEYWEQRAKKFGITGENALQFEDFEEVFGRLGKQQSPFDNTEEDLESAKAADNSASSRLKRISKGNALFTEDLFDLGFLRSDGERVYNQQFKNRFHQVMDELKNPTRREQYKQGKLLEIESGKWFTTDENFYKYNNLLHSKNFNALLDNGGVEISALEGIRQVGETAQDTGAVFNTMTPREYLVSNINYFRQGQRKRLIDGKTINTAPVTIGLLETARTALFFHTPTISGVYNQGVGDITVNRLSNEISKELHRIAQAMYDEKLAEMQGYQNGQDVKKFYYDKYGYHIHKFNPVKQGNRKVRAFGFSDTVRYFTNGAMQELASKIADNAMEGLATNNGMIPFDAVQLDQSMKDHIRKQATTLFDQFVTDMIKEGVIDKTYQGSNSLLASSFYDGTKEGLMNNLGDAYFNILLNGIAMKQIIVGDPALNYKNDGADPTKRAKSINAAVQSIEHHGNDELGLKPWRQSKVLITEEAVVPATYTPGTSSTSIADAQMYMSMKALKNTLFGLGKLSPALADALDRIDRGEAIENEEVFNDENGMIARHEMLNPLKLVYRDGHRTLKMSGFTLTKELTSKLVNGKWEARPGYEHLHNLREHMENTDTDFVLNESGTKTLTLNVLYKDATGNYDYSQARPTMFDNMNFGLQLENPSNKTKITEPTQLQRLIDNEQQDDVQVWSEALGKFAPIKDVKKEYNDYIYSRSVGEFYKSFNELYDVNNAMEDFDKSISDKKITFSLDRFIGTAVESLKASGGDPQLIKLFEDRKNPNIPIMKSKFMQLYMAYFSKSAFSLKTPGHKMTLVSPDGFKILKQKTANGWRVVRKDSAEYNKITNVPDLSSLIYVYDEQMEKDRLAEYNSGLATDEEGNIKNPNEAVKGFRDMFDTLQEGAYFTDTLRHNVPEYNDKGEVTGWYSEVMAPTHFSDLISSPDEEIPLNKALGARIPSQDKHSFINMKFVDTIPAYYGSSIVPCKEIIELSGADFDIDSLFVMTEAFYTENGKSYAYNNLSPEKEFELYKAYEMENNKMVSREAYDKKISREAAMQSLNLPTTQQEYQELKKKLGVETLLKPLADNKILYSRMNLLNNPYTLVEAKTAIEPATQDKLIAVDKFELKGKRLFEVNGQSIFIRDYSGFPVNSLNYQYNKFRDNTVGKDNIGIAVNGNLIGSELLKNKVKLRKDFITKIDGLTLSEFTQYTNSYGTRILDIISTLISAATDEAKDGNNAKYGISPEALRAVVPMTLMGTRLETAVALINQPILQEFFAFETAKRASIMTPEEYRNFKYSQVGLKNLLEKHIEKNEGKFKIAPVEEWYSEADDFAFGIEELTKVLRQQKYIELGLEIPQEDYLRYTYDTLQRKVVLMYEAMAAISQESQTISSRIKFNGGLPSEISDFKRILSGFNEIVRNDKQQPFSPKALITPGLNKAMYELGNQINSALSETFLSESEAFKKVMDSVQKNLKRNMTPTEQQMVERDTESFVYFEGYKNYLEKKYGKSYEELRQDNRLSLIYKNELESTIADMYKNILAKNRSSPIRKLLIPILTKTGQGKTIKSNDIIEGLSFRSISKLQEQELGDISDGILELMVSDNPEYRRFAQALWDYFIVKDGFQFRMGTVSKILPTIMFDELSEAIDAMQKDGDIPIKNSNRLVELMGESKEYDRLVQYMNFAKAGSSVSVGANTLKTNFSRIEEGQEAGFWTDPELPGLIFPAYLKVAGKLFKLDMQASKGSVFKNQFLGTNALYKVVNQRGSESASPTIDLAGLRPLALGEKIEHPWFPLTDPVKVEVEVLKEESTPVKSEEKEDDFLAFSEQVPNTTKEKVPETSLSTSGSLVLNPEQKSAVNQAIDFIKNGDPKQYFVLEGKAGTGKTTIAEQIAREFPKANIQVAALSHKAKAVIRDKFTNAKITNADFSSLAGLLGQKLNMETGMFTKDPDAPKTGELPIEVADIVIIDEASMINEEALSLIMELKDPSSKVLFLGDIGQLPPIRTQENPYFAKRTELFGKKSPVFTGGGVKAKLLTRVRQGEESPILPFADFFWNNSQVSSPVTNPVSSNRKNIITRKGSLLFTPSFKNIQEQVVESFKIGIKDNNPNHIKVVTYRNASRQAINKLVHDSVFGSNSPLYNSGEIIIFNNSYGKIENSTETYVISAEEKQLSKHGLAYFPLKISVDADISSTGVKLIKVLAPEAKAEHSAMVSKLFAEAKNMQKGTPQHRMKLKEAWDLRNAFAEIDYGYAITSHKSQGSTYDMVVVDEGDIMSVSPISNKEKSEAIYTALTRARNVVISISPNNQLQDIPNIESLNNLTAKVENENDESQQTSC